METSLGHSQGLCSGFVFRFTLRVRVQGQLSG
uniref:Uncharacterized protein n=1 Tax=Anguilla anguilla TaxID=7936 RepID=A0A0E9R6L3_ANGAN